MTPRSLRHLIASLSIALALPAAATMPAFADEPAPPIPLDLLARGHGCPTPAQLAATLRAASPRFALAIEPAPDFTLSLPAGAPSHVPVAVLDEGLLYQVMVGGQVRVFRDPARRCAERARTAAVLVALTLDPPSVKLPHDDLDLEALLRDEPQPSAPVEPTPPPVCPVPPPAPACPAPPPVAAPKPPPARHAAVLTLSGAVDGPVGGPAGTAGSVTGGGRVEADLVWHGVGFSVGAQGMSPAELVNAGVRARLVRTALDVGAVGALRLGPAEGVLGLGMGVLVDAIDDVGPPAGGWTVRAEPLLRAAAGLRLWLAPRVALALGLQALISLKPVAFRTYAGDPLGQTPRAWLGGTLGVAWALTARPK